MKMFLRCALATALAASVSAPAAAGELRLTMANGRVTLIAARRHGSRDPRGVGPRRPGENRQCREADRRAGHARADRRARSARAGHRPALGRRLRHGAADRWCARSVALRPHPDPRDQPRRRWRPPPNPAPFANRPMPQTPQAQPNPNGEDEGDFNPPPVINPLGADTRRDCAAGAARLPPAQPAGPMTPHARACCRAPPAAQPTTNPYLGTPPGQTSPTFNPNPAPVPTTPRPPGGPGGAGSLLEGIGDQGPGAKRAALADAAAPSPRLNRQRQNLEPWALVPGPSSSCTARIDEARGSIC